MIFYFLLWHNHWKRCSEKIHLGTIPQLFQAANCRPLSHTWFPTVIVAVALCFVLVVLVLIRLWGIWGWAGSEDHDQWPKNGLLENTYGLTGFRGASQCGKAFSTAAYVHKDRTASNYFPALQSWIKLIFFTNIFVLGLMCGIKGFIWMKEHDKTPGVQIIYSSQSRSQKLADFFLRYCRLILCNTSFSRVRVVGVLSVCETTRRNYSKKSINELKPYQL